MITAFAYYTPNFQALADVTLPNIRQYCERQGYGFIAHLDHNADEDPRPFGFRKTEQVLQCLRSLQYGRDLILVLDIDLLVTNQTVRVESFLEDESDLFVTHDINGLNSGVYIIRSTIGMEKFLEDVIGRWGNPGVLGEQDAMRDSLRLESFASLRKIVPHPAFNSFLYEEYGIDRAHEDGQWSKGDFILHLPGMSNEKRIELFTSPAIQGAIIE